MNDGGPVFPIKNYKWIGDDDYKDHDGMTLRDYFASKAMQGLLTDQKEWIDEGEFMIVELAEQAYEIADAMLNQRGES